MTNLNNTTNCNNRQSIFIKASEVCEVMEISRASAYRLIKQLNEELATKGYLVVNGKTNRDYFYDRIYRKAC